MHRGVLPFGAFSARNQRRDPNDDSLRQRASVSHSRKSMSWQHFEISIGLVISSRRHMPRTNPCVVRSSPTAARWLIDMISPSWPESTISLILMK